MLQIGTPMEIYDRPNCRFVAEFIGTANIIPAERNGGKMVTPVGKLELPTLPDWKEGALAIRPEGVLLRDSEPAKNAVRATVTEAYYRGNFQDITLEPGKLRMRCAPHKKIAVGDTVWVELLEDALVAIHD